MKGICRALYYFSLILFLGCNKDNVEVIPQKEIPTNIDARLLPYFDNFLLEASLRGFELAEEVYNLKAEIVEIDEQHIAGQCNYNRVGGNEIIIDEEFFNTVPFLLNEFIVFHEMGHCILFRDHLEDSRANGTCVSMMRSGTEDCRDNYTPNMRSAYIDELFSRMDEL